jgi:membrane protein
MTKKNGTHPTKQSRTRPFISFIKEVYRIWLTERPNQQAAALAYFGMFSFVPLIIIALSVIGFLAKNDAVIDQFYLNLESTFGAEISNQVSAGFTTLIETTSKGNTIISIISFLAILLAASGLFFQLQLSLNTMWRVPIPKRGRIFNFLRQRLLSYLLVIVIAVVGSIAMMTNFGLAWFGTLLGKLFGISTAEVIVTGVSTVLLIATTLALFYRYLPETKVTWKDVWLGTLIATTLVVLGISIVGLFFKNSSFTSGLQAAGALSVLLIGIYYIAQIFLAGAISCRVYAYLFGSRSTESKEIDKI